MADILIRGKEMPQNCIDCMFTTIDCDMCILEKNYLMLCGGRPSWCPLVPLPEGHGKIIDGDALWENMTVEQSEAFQKGLAGTIELFEMLEAATPIVPAEGGEADGN